MPSAVWGSGTGITVLAYMWVAAVAVLATGQLVDVNTHHLGPWFSVEVSRRTDIFSMIRAQADAAVGFTKAHESHCPQFKVYLTQA